jgi:hypothetical protein
MRIFILVSHYAVATKERYCLIPDITVNGTGIAVTGKGKRSD